MNRFDSSEVSPVLESDVDGMGGMECVAFPSLADAEKALADANEEGLSARLFWTLYGHIDGEGVEAIQDFESEDLAFLMLYKITGIVGWSGTTVYQLAEPRPAPG